MLGFLDAGLLLSMNTSDRSRMSLNASITNDDDRIFATTTTTITTITIMD